MRTGSIYIIRNKCNDKVYIGQTTQSVEERFKQHLKPSQIKRFHYKLYRAMDKYGKENFYVETLETDIPYEQLDNKEIYYIEKFDSFKNGYNSTLGGDVKTIYKIDDIDDIVNRLKRGDLIRDVAKDYGVCTTTINRCLDAYGIDSYEIQDHKKNGYYLKLPREKIKELYLQGKSHKEIASELKIDPRSVSRVVKEYGIGKKKMIDYSKLDLGAILEDYHRWQNGEIKLKDVWAKYGLNQNSIKYILKITNQPKEKSID